MRTQLNNDSIIDVTGEVIDTIPARSRGFSIWPTARSASDILEDAVLEAQEQRFRALLAQGALQQLGALSMMESQLTSIAPQSGSRFREVVDAYAEREAERIRRW